MTLRLADHDYLSASSDALANTRFETASIQFMGPRKVCKPDLGNRMFFAGVRADSTMATHNIRMKPIEEMP